MTRSRINKPRVFLSHSKADEIFIARLCEDLRLCQVDPWLDSVEIRHGKPWLDEIFEEGIPTCDAVLVYLTSHSIQSPMVKKEIDAAMIQKLRDSHIAFLPYVSDPKLRDELRADIQALQTPNWNGDNYLEMLPRVVAEIWRSFLERVVISVADAEKVKRLEAELELERLKKSEGDGIFSAREVADFQCIWNALDRYETVEFQQKQHNENVAIVLRTWSSRVHLQNLVTNLDAITWQNEYSEFAVQNTYQTTFPEKLPKHEPEKGLSISCSKEPDLKRELLMYGLLQRISKANTRLVNEGFNLNSGYAFVFAEKFYRFRYWLAHCMKLSAEPRWEPVSDNTTSASLAESTRK